MADFKWYEQRCFVWSDDKCTREPTSVQLDAMLAVLTVDGWEDDPVFGNGSGTVNVRRLYKPLQTEGAGSRAEEPVDENSPGFGDLIETEYPGATWKLTVKGGAW